MEEEKGDMQLQAGIARNATHCQRHEQLKERHGMCSTP